MCASQEDTDYLAPKPPAAAAITDAAATTATEAAVATAGAAADERVIVVFMFALILPNPPLGRTLGVPFFTTEV